MSGATAGTAVGTAAVSVAAVVAAVVVAVVAAAGAAAAVAPGQAGAQAPIRPMPRRHVQKSPAMPAGTSLNGSCPVPWIGFPVCCKGAANLSPSR